MGTVRREDDGFDNPGMAYVELDDGQEGLWWPEDLELLPAARPVVRQSPADRCLLARLRVTFGAGVVGGLLAGMRESATDPAALARYRAALAALYAARGGSPEQAAALAVEVQRIALWGAS